MRSRLELVIYEWNNNLHAYVQLVDPAPDRRHARRRRLRSWSLDQAPDGARQGLEEAVARCVEGWFKTTEIAVRSTGSASPWGDRRGV